MDRFIYAPWVIIGFINIHYILKKEKKMGTIQVHESDKSTSSKATKLAGRAETGICPAFHANINLRTKDNAT
jgi:hypothetical protein